MRAEVADVLIAGGGGVGSAVAYFLTALGGDKVRVTVAERDPTYAHAATMAAAGGIRQHFSTPENVLMSQFGYEFLGKARETLAIDGEGPEVSLTPHPYLRLEGAAGADAARAHAEMQRSLGATPEVLEPDALAKRFPWMNIEDIAVGVLGGAFEGTFDPQALLWALRRKAIAQGAQYLAAAVVGIERNGAVNAVQLSDGTRLAPGVLVNAAGPGGGAVAALAGIDLAVSPLKAQTFAFRAERPLANCPIVLDRVQGLNFKPEGAMYLAAAARDSRLRGPDDFDIDPHLFDDSVWPALAHRAPQLETLKYERGWVGHIDWHAFDANPVLGPHPACRNFVFANGLSGHGAQHLPAVGRAIAELLLYGEYRTLDLSRFSYERLLTQTPVRELV